ncbi:Swt1 family HEPN domain-containing protein [Frankia sp. QA3]|uniref:Swt1 family HEPN domain-containing protein n=1 Tax=Frankia sp. QA3 TaxID=710111 RepID=UPI000269BC3F|nr:Swt1 family HEPN domain-containing protein [Frankia sp. QA3]EIV91760.1 putative ATPase (AAA+ superfamily) [Frankia sp. QA3]
MALSNRDRIDGMFQILAPALDDFISSVIGQAAPALGAEWTKLVQAKDLKNGVPAGKSYDPLDPQVQFRVLTEGNITGAYKHGWYPFNQAVGRAGETFASELREVRNEWAHNGSFTDDDAYRALDTGERLLKLIGASAEAEEVRGIRLNLRRVTADKDDKKVLKAAVDNPEAAGLKPWREVLQPHDDVATGNFHASEFAADLYKVATGGEVDSDYADPVEFFRRTYLTEGLRDLVGRAVRRLSGDDNVSPVINLQTNFGGGKTHSMLSLWHVAAGLPVGKFPQETQELLTANGYAGTKVNRVAIVGNHLSPSGATKDDGTRVNTIWGELAWQLGGAEAYAIVATADSNRTHPGEALHTLLATYAPAVILIDEWVAYARSLVGRDDLAGGTFDDQFTFAQSLTEAAKGTSGVLLAISIPASESGVDSEIVVGSAEEVGGANGLEALKRLQNVVRRVADQWRPASPTEAYNIVRQRLFKQPDAAALAAIGATAKAYVELYRKYTDDFPREARDPAYEYRLRQTYPIHPELFDTLYEEWSSLERFQRTRGVLRLMSTVIHALWTGEDASPLIMPGSIPLATANVNAELTQYLQDSWKTIIDADVDGPNSEPARIDTAKPLFGQRALTRRLARTVFFGAAPTVAPGSVHKGIGTQRVFLGTAIPGDVPGNFHAALTQLGDRATYFYSGSGKYWYDLQANITRTAKDQAERLHKEDVWKEIVTRLLGQGRVKGDFAGVHVCPETNADLPDTGEARLVILHPKFAHKRGTESAAKNFAQKATEQRGSSNRTNRNMLVYLAPDEARLEELDTATRDYLGWKHVLDNEADLDLTQNQKNQAAQRQAQADQTVTARLLQTFTWALVPAQPEPNAPFLLRETKVEGQSTSLAERVSRRLGNDGDLSTQQAAATIRLAISKVPQIWKDGHVSLGTLWGLYSQYPYMPRLRDRTVLNAGVIDMPLHWQIDGFALAAGYDDSAGRYVGLWLPDEDKNAAPTATDSLLLVRPDVAVQQRAAEVPTPDPEKRRNENDENDEKKPFKPDPGHRGVHHREPKTRFYGVKTLNSDKIALDFKNVADEIIANLRQDGTELVVKIEIEATKSTGFEEGQVRTVSENAGTLKFDQSGFEES